MILRAKYVLDPEFCVQSDWAVRVDGRRIVEIGSARAVTGSEVCDLGDALLMPGLVNAHTHLELGFARGRVLPTHDFANWLGRLLDEIRAAVSDARLAEESIVSGLSESLRTGTTLIGDITRSPQQTRTLIAREANRPSVVSFGEVIAIGKLRGGSEGRISDAAESTDHDVNQAELHAGISPHAPYTVEPDIIRRCATIAHEQDLPLCIHAAETPEEDLFMRELTGPLRDHLVRVGVWDDQIKAASCGPIELLDRCGALGQRTLLAHANYVSPTDIERIASTQTNVAYCPRTHAAFEHARHPFREMLARGINVCLGTDSLASNPSLSMLDELRFLMEKNSDVDPVVLLQMATINGAQALGFAKATGTLERGKRADIIALPIAHGSIEEVIRSAILSAEMPAFTMVAGEVANRPEHP